MKVSYNPAFAGLGATTTVRPGAPTGSTGGTNAPASMLLIGHYVPVFGRKQCKYPVGTEQCKNGVLTNTLEPGWTADVVAKVNKGILEQLESESITFTTAEEQYKALTVIAAERMKAFGAPDTAIAYLASFPWANKDVLQEFATTGTSSVVLANNPVTGAATVKAASMSTGAIVGIALGAVVFVGVLTVLFLKKPRRAV